MSGASHDDRPAEELRLLALGLLDRVEPGLRALLARLREQPAQEHSPACTWCPVCAVAGLLRGERPELAAAIGHHADGLITALRAVLAEPVQDAGTPAEGGGEARRVQRIEVRADGGC